MTRLSFSLLKRSVMEMTMHINGQLVDSIKVHVDTHDNERYLNWLKEGLRLKHQYLLNAMQTEPSFYLVLPQNNKK